jgi:hypothetical protein
VHHVKALVRQAQQQLAALGGMLGSLTIWSGGRGRNRHPLALLLGHCPLRHGAALGSPATAAHTVARRRDALPRLLLSFVTHLRYNEPDRLFPFPHRLLHAASA